MALCSCIPNLPSSAATPRRGYFLIRRSRQLDRRRKNEIEPESALWSLIGSNKFAHSEAELNLRGIEVLDSILHRCKGRTGDRQHNCECRNVFMARSSDHPARRNDSHECSCCRGRMADHMELDRLATAEARECFKVRYQGDAHVQVYGQVRGLCSTANKSVHYSPYTTFVQSSGVGKTRCVMEMSTLGVYVCYCSLAGKSSSAYPPRTEFLADRLATAFTELEAVLYLKAWLVVLAKAVAQGVAAVAWKEQQLGSSDIAKAVRDEWEALIAATPAKAYAEDLRGRDSANVSILKDAMDNVDKLLGRAAGLGGAGRARVLFVFDEARGLHHLASETAASSTSPFCQVRRAFRAFFARRTFFALMLDTAATITNLLPRKSDEDSSRALKIGIGLLPPIIYLPTLQLNMPKPGLRLEEYVRPAAWMKYGRPMWAARMAVEGEGQDMLSGNLLVFATQKLMGDFCDEFSSNGTMTEGQAVALLSAAAGVQICPRSPLAEKLAASHMHLRVTYDRSGVYVSLPAEPILSEAAAHLLQNEQVKQKALMHMEAACRAGDVTGGPRGEFVAILTAAVWSCVESMSGNWYLQPISVEDFLRQLLGASKSAFAKVEPKLPEGGIVFFHSFVAVGEVPGPGMLAKCFAAGHAIMYQADDTVPGADLIVPVWTPSGKMTCMIVSVWLEALSVDTVRSEVTRVEVDAGLPTVAVLMSLREPAVASPMGWLFWDQADRLYVQLTCYGIDGNYDYLSGEVKELLKAILITRPDLLEGASNQEKQWIKEMLPYQYQPAPNSFPVHP